MLTRSSFQSNISVRTLASLERAALIAAAACLALGCGGAVDTTLLDGGGGDDGGGGGSDGGGGGSDGGGGDPCNALLAQVTAAQPAAIQCCPTCNVMQCGHQVDGLCCPLTVSLADAAGVKQYLAALKAFRDAKCQVNCPAIACAADPTGNCQQDGTCAQF